MNWYLNVFRKYSVFKGRSRRKEYWFFFLFNILISIVLGIIDGLTGTFSPESGLGLLGVIFMLAVLIPSLAVSIRRLHDTNRSGWWLLISLIPIIGTIVIIVFMASDSKPGDNKYGENPKLAIA
ncbi:DUF805 domain-containing protein [Reinekea sp.]|jgi:uncharacterized membrane protein YhaH (DUF805 family)|uniref:DUF805 domain-containing protein n=1 Tax=Reinekea sp. TaxID=1970455 RepID=UPI002A83CCA0|nr:DUF805 domain-containing protein [Reinekea sp.]